VRAVPADVFLLDGRDPRPPGIRGAGGSLPFVRLSPSPDRPSLPTRPPGAGTARPWPPRGTSSATPTRAPPPS
jgi:hypothetical protein